MVILENSINNEVHPKKLDTKLINNNYIKIIFAVSILAILLLTVYLRLGMSSYEGFFSPDGFFKFAVLKEAIANNYAIPQYLKYSGFPTHNFINNRLGGYYVSLYPYILLKMLGLKVSIYNIMRYIPLLFGLLDVIGVYFLVQYLSKSKLLGIIAMFMVAAVPANFSVTAALVYRGDIFISIFAIASAILFIKSANNLVLKKKILYAVGSSVILGFGSMIWGGAPFTVAIYLLAVILMLIIDYIKADEFGLKSAIVLIAVLPIEYVMEHIFVALNVIREAEFLTGISFFVFYLPILIGAIIAYLIIYKRSKNINGNINLINQLTMNSLNRFITVACIAVLAIGVISILFSGIISTILSGGGLVSANSALGKTIEELEPPSIAFMWSSFNIQIILFVIGTLIYLFFNDSLNQKGKINFKFKLSNASNNLTPQFIIIISYLFITGYLQSQATRYNSLFSIPVAIFSAFAIYSIYEIIKKSNNETSIYKKINLYVGNINYVYFGLVTGLVIIALLYAFSVSSSMVPSDDINTAFLSSLSWMRNNTPTNATVLAVWPDGSEVEGWAQRQSSTDSVAGQNPKLIAGFSRFLFNDSPDLAYLNTTHNPNYLLDRNYWWLEAAGIEEEGLLANLNKTEFNKISYDYGITFFSSSSEKKYADGIYYVLSSPYIDSVLVYNTTNPNNTYALEKLPGSKNYSYVKHVVISDISNYQYETFNHTNDSANLTLYLETSDAGTKFAAMLGPKMFKSNFLKFTTFCNYTSCNYDENGSVKLKMVYANSDARIFKITYNNSTN